jgi:glycosyltransferase involved in cell wall biosynthesis
VNKDINITVATSLTGQGGIATVLSTLQQTGFFKRTNSVLVTSHKQGKLGKLSMFVNFFIAFSHLTVLLLSNRVGVVHFHMASRGSYSRKSLLVRIAKKLQAKVIIHLHGAEFQVFYNNESSQSKQAHIRETFDMADRVIVLSSQWQQWLNVIVKSPEKIQVVYNAVPEVILPNKNETKDVILFLGRLGTRKGVDDLINAFALISKQHPNAELHLGGDGDLPFYQKMTTKLDLEKQVKFLGWVAGDKKAQHLSNATIYCLPSYNEGFPMGVLEAMSSSVAVISSKAGGIPDAITDKREGILIDAGNVQQLADSLSLLLKDRNLRDEYKRAALDKYRNHFSPGIINAQLETIYNELVE